MTGMRAAQDGYTKVVAALLREKEWHAGIPMTTTNAVRIASIVQAIAAPIGCTKALAAIM